MAININAKTTGVGGLETSADNSGEINIQSGGSTVMNVTSSGVAVTGSFSQNGAVYSTQPTFRNLIINGDMKIAQRGTSTSGITSGNYFTLDRFYTNNSSVGSFTQSQDTDVPSGQGFSNSLKLSCDTSDTPVTSEWTSVQCRLEAQMLSHLKYGTASAESTTLSFWVKSNKTGTYTLAIYKDDTTAQGISKTYTIDTADTWEKKTITIEGHTSNSIANDNSIGLRLYWIVATGPDRQSSPLQTSWGAYDSTAFVSSSQVNLADSTANYINITGVQLEVGSTATEFEHLPYDVELARCQRYYQTYVNMRLRGVIGSPNTRANRLAAVLPVKMRTAPTISIVQRSGMSSHVKIYDGGITGIFTSIVAQYNDEGQVELDLTMDTSGTTGRAACVYYAGSAQSDFNLDGEL